MNMSKIGFNTNRTSIVGETNQPFFNAARPNSLTFTPITSKNYIIKKPQ